MRIFYHIDFSFSKRGFIFCSSGLLWDLAAVQVKNVGVKSVFKWDSLVAVTFALGCGGSVIPLKVSLRYFTRDVLLTPVQPLRAPLCQFLRVFRNRSPRLPFGRCATDESCSNLIHIVFPNSQLATPFPKTFPSSPIIFFFLF